MREAFRNLLEMNPQNLILEVYIGLGIIWVMTLVAGIWSVLNSRSSGWLKAFWIILMVGLPLLGMLAYAFYCLLQLDYRVLTNRAQAARQLNRTKGMGAADAPISGITA